MLRHDTNLEAFFIRFDSTVSDEMPIAPKPIAENEGSPIDE